MTDEDRHTPARTSEVRAWIVALLGGLAVLLLVVANLQLKEERGVRTETVRPQAAQVQPSTIPAPVAGTSNKVLSEELKGVSTSLSRPIDLLREQMAPLAGLTEGQAELSKSFGNVASSLSGLGALRTQLRKMSSGLGAVVGNTKSMSGSLDDTAATLKAVEHGIGSTSEQTTGMVEAMKTVNESINSSGASTNEAFGKMNEGIEAMRASFGEIDKSLAGTSAGTQEMKSSLVEMKASMVTLNANMEKFLKLFCTVLTGEAGCPAATAE